MFKFTGGFLPVVFTGGFYRWFLPAIPAAIVAILTALVAIPVAILTALTIAAGHQIRTSTRKSGPIFFF